MSAASSNHLPASTDPAVVAVCLDWLHDTLPWPRAPRGWADSSSGFTRPTGRPSTVAYRECEQCNGRGTIRRGECPNCEGQGGWHYDPMDERRAALRTSADAHPERDAPVVRIVRLSSATTVERLEDDDARLPPTLITIVAALEELRRRDRYQRAVLQRVHVIRIDTVRHLRPAEVELYVAALEQLAGLLPAGFRAPRWARQKALPRAATSLHH